MQMLVTKFVNKRRNKEYEKKRTMSLWAQIEELFNLFGHTLFLIVIIYNI